MTATEPRTTAWIDADPQTFETRFEREPFAFPHRLTGHPLFELDKLIDLAKILAPVPGNVVYDAGDVRVDQRWDEVPLCDLPAHELIAKIETAGAWVLLKNADTQPGYREILRACYEDTRALSGGALDRVMKKMKSIVFLNSPNRVTSYHIDHQSSLLFQIRGYKTISIFDRTDRDVISERELETFWARDANAAIYKPALQGRARTFELGPGMAVHIPVNAPHWVQNGPEISVSLNVNFDFHDRLLGDLYRTNYWLRKLGLRPTPPNRSRVEDFAKASACASARALVKGVRKIRR